MRNLLFIIFLLLASPSSGQNTSELTDFHGGKYKFDLSFSNNFFSGVGSKVGGMGGDYGGLLPQSESLLWNPANLCFIKNHQITIDFTPPITINPGSFVDINSEIRPAVDNGIADIKGENFSMEDQDYPDLRLAVGMEGGFRNGCFAFRSGDFVLAGAIFQPFDLALNLIGVGLEARIKTIEEDPTEEIIFLGSLDFSLSVMVRIQGVSLGLARRITPRWGIGASLERLSGTARINAQFPVEGIMVTAGIERAFNDPNDPWENDLHSYVRGGYEGTANIFKIGTTYKINDRWGIGGVLSISRPLKMAGDLRIKQRTLPGLNLETEDILDPTQIDLDEPTKTIERRNPTGKLLVLNLPSSLGIGVSGRIGFLGLSLNYNRYFKEFSYSYEVVRDNEEVKYSDGIKLKNGLRLGLDLKYLTLGMGFLTGEIIGEPQNITLPTFSLGTGFRPSGTLRIDLLLFALPSGVGKVSATYYF